MRSEKRNFFVLLIVITILALVLTSCGSRELPVSYSFSIGPGADYITLFLAFNKPIKGFSMRCEDHSTGQTTTIYDNVDMTTSSSVILNGYNGWGWGPNQKMVLSGKGFDSISVTIPDRDTTGWNQFVAQAQAEGIAASSGIQPDSGGDLQQDSGGIQLDTCKSFKKQYADCMEDYNLATNEVSQIQWLTLCNDLQNKVTKYCQ